jgi:hypothetical protein
MLMPTLTFLPEGPTIDVPDDAEGERAAVAAHPYSQEVRRVSRERRARGERGVPLTELAARYGIDASPSKKLTGRRPTEASGKVSLRLPTELHRELIAQAARQKVSLNTLMVAYLAREVGVEAHEGSG